MGERGVRGRWTADDLFVWLWDAIILAGWGALVWAVVKTVREWWS